MASKGRETRVKTRKTIPAKENQYEVGDCFISTDPYFKETTLCEVLFVTDRDPQGMFVVYHWLVINHSEPSKTSFEEEVRFELFRDCELKYFTKISKEDYLRYRIDPNGKWKEAK